MGLLRSPKGKAIVNIHDPWSQNFAIREGIDSFREGGSKYAASNSTGKVKCAPINCVSNKKGLTRSS